MAEIPRESIDCAIRHINAFVRQTHDKETANIAEPCAECRQAQTCGYAWLSRLKPLLENSNETIRVIFPLRQHIADTARDSDTAN